MREGSDGVGDGERGRLKRKGLVGLEEWGVLVEGSSGAEAMVRVCEIWCERVDGMKLCHCCVACVGGNVSVSFLIVENSRRFHLPNWESRSSFSGPQLLFHFHRPLPKTTIMSKLSYGLNITKKPPLGQRPPPAKRKTIFDDDSGPEDGPDDEDTLESISNIGGLQPSSKPKSSKTAPTAPPSRPTKPPKISQYGDLSTNHSTNKHSKSAQDLDPNIYDYDAVYDSLHAKPTSSTSTADIEKKPKYMGNLLAAAEVRKRDQLRAKEKMLAKERELEGDEFADKEKFVTGAYKRQQEEMKRLEEEEVIKEREAEERKRREGGGMKALYKNLLERDELKHKEVMKAVEEGRGKEDKVDGEEKEGKKGSQ